MRSSRIHRRCSLRWNARMNRSRPRNGKLVEPAFTDPPEPPSEFPDVVVPALAEHHVGARQGPVDPFGDRFAIKPKASSQGRRAIVREAQKVESLRLAHPALAPVHFSEPAKLQEVGLIPVKAGTKPGQPPPNVAEVSLRVPLVLEPDNGSSRPGESHPEALSEPCLNLSAHTAPPMQPACEAYANVRTGKGLGQCIHQPSVWLAADAYASVSAFAWPTGQASCRSASEMD